MHNSIMDVAGLRVGNAHAAVMMSGVTAIVFDTPAVASVSVLGGAPAGRDLGCLEPEASVSAVDAIVLSGGSGFGLDAASGAQAWLRDQGRGLLVGSARVPIVPSAILFDLNNGGDKGWGRYPPYRELGYQACVDSQNGGLQLGTSGAGYGAATFDLKGGLGSASTRTSSGYTVAALVAVNALGSALLAGGPHFWAAPLEQDGEFGNLGFPTTMVPAAAAPHWKGQTSKEEASKEETAKGGTVPPAMPTATTIACVATDARLTKPQTKRLSIAANAGLARGLRLSHAAMDGDTIFAAATGVRDAEPNAQDLIEIGALAADCLSRAIARAVYLARIPPSDAGSSGQAFHWSGPPAWVDRFGKAPSGR